MMQQKNSRLRYVVNGTELSDTPVLLKKTNANVYFSLGSRFDAYQFRRFSVSQDQVDQSLESRVNFLRKKYDYIRLWFGGGKDCTLALETFIKHNVKIDEIVVARRCCENNLGLYTEFNPLIEIDKSAVEKLKTISEKIPDTLITVIDFDDREFEAVFENPDWYLKITEWFFSVGYYPILVHRHINPKHNILKVHSNMCELVGSAVPFVYRDPKLPNWRFGFNSAGFSCIGPSNTPSVTFEDFLMTDDNPSICELHVNSIIDSFEKDNYDLDYKENVRQFQRTIRDRSLFFKNLNYNEFQFSKNDLDIEPPSQDYFWKAGQSTRTFYELINRFHQDPMPRSLELYIKNTNWNLIKNYIETNGINTINWILK